MADGARRLKSILLVALGTATAGCAFTRPFEGPVRFGQIAFVGGPRVRPDRVVEDSRCPLGVDCVRAGRMILQVTVLGGGWSRKFDLEIGKTVHVADGTLALVAATPPRRSRDPVRGSAYRFAFEFKGGR